MHGPQLLSDRIPAPIPGEHRTLKTGEAATLLHVTPNTLRVWERRFGFPRPARAPGHSRRYRYEEIVALRDALSTGLGISSAIELAQAAHGCDADALRTALGGFRGEPPDQVMESSLAVRSVEDTLELVLFPALEGVLRRSGPTSAYWSFSLGWAMEWLARSRRLARSAGGLAGVVIADDTDASLDPLRAYALGLALCCGRSGLDTLIISYRAPDRLDEILRAFAPSAVVLVGPLEDAAALWTFRVTRDVRIPSLRYDPKAASGTHGVLPGSPRSAAQTLLGEVLGDGTTTSDAVLRSV